MMLWIGMNVKHQLAEVPLAIHKLSSEGAFEHSPLATLLLVDGFGVGIEKVRKPFGDPF